MCGIVATCNRGDAAEFVVKALKRLQYRGYDSWGVAGFPDNKSDTPHLSRYLGRIDGKNVPACVTAIGHTRWATHGRVELNNTHPIGGGIPTPKVWVVHNGVIENHDKLRTELQQEGVDFSTETDTEVIAQLLAFGETEDPVGKCRVVCGKLEGYFAFAACFSGEIVVLAARGCPLYVSDLGYAASDLNALAGYGTKAYRLKYDEVVALLPPDEFTDTIPQLTPTPKGEPHRMLTEIQEQPATLRVRTTWENLGLEFGSRLKEVRLFGCGSSYNAALLGKQYFETLTGVPARVDYATEIPSAPFYDTPGTAWVGLTQSGETKDTLNALEFLRPRVGNRLFVLTNNLRSSAARFTRCVGLFCGPEYSVAATKTFTAQVARLLDLAAARCENRGILRRLHEDLPGVIENFVSNDQGIQNLAQFTKLRKNILFLARGSLYPVAKEGALKMKEVAYVHAEAMHSSEMKHGPIALIDEDTLSIFLLTSQDGQHVNRVRNNILEVRARGGTVIAIADASSNWAVSGLAGSVLLVPSVHPLVQPILVAVALQLLGYYVAVFKGLNVDYPRNLAKCCTVE